MATQLPTSSRPTSAEPTRTLIYDSTVIRPGEPAFVVATRGLLLFPRFASAPATPTSTPGLYGGAALNAAARPP